MRSLYQAFPDAASVLSLDSDQLAGLLIFPFRNLPWRAAAPVRRCVLVWVMPYPEHSREALVEALMNVWQRLLREGLLAVPLDGAVAESSTGDPAIRLRA